MEAFLHTVARMEDKVQIVLYLLGQLPDQLRLPVVQTVEFLPTAVLMAEVVRTV